MPLSSRMVASRAIPVSSGELPPLPAIASAAPSLPRPRKWHGCGCHRLRIIPVPLVRRTVAYSARMGNAGELPAAANGGAAVSTPNSGGPRLSSPPPSNPHRSSQDQRSESADTPSRVLLLKRPRPF
jgi:hypothetical protein